MTAGSARITDVRVRGGTLGALSLVEVTSDKGVTGIGATGSPVPAIDAIVRGCGLADLVIGEDPLEPRRLWQRMFHRWQAQRGRASEGGLAVNAMGAIDMALWDLKGKQAFAVAVNAREHGMRCVPHGPWSALTVAAHLHILASVGAGGMVEYPGFDALPESTAVPAHIAQFEIVEHPPELVDGRLRLPGRPGLGLGNFVAEGVRGLETGGRC